MEVSSSGHVEPPHPPKPKDEPEWLSRLMDTFHRDGKAHFEKEDLAKHEKAPARHGSPVHAAAAFAKSVVAEEKLEFALAAQERDDRSEAMQRRIAEHAKASIAKIELAAKAPPKDRASQMKERLRGDRQRRLAPQGKQQADAAAAQEMIDQYEQRKLAESKKMEERAKEALMIEERKEAKAMEEHRAEVQREERRVEAKREERRAAKQAKQIERRGEVSGTKRKRRMTLAEIYAAMDGKKKRK